MKKLIVLLSLNILFAQVPHKISFQAYLTDANNMPVAPGSYEITFRIYDASEDVIYNAVPSVVYPWSTDLAFYVISISVFRDCNEDLGGEAFIDSCNECIGVTQDLKKTI